MYTNEDHPESCGFNFHHTGGALYANSGQCRPPRTMQAASKYRRSATSNVSDLILPSSLPRPGSVNGPALRPLRCLSPARPRSTLSTMPTWMAPTSSARTPPHGQVGISSTGHRSVLRKCHSCARDALADRVAGGSRTWSIPLMRERHRPLREGDWSTTQSVTVSSTSRSLTVGHPVEYWGARSDHRRRHRIADPFIPLPRQRSTRP